MSNNLTQRLSSQDAAFLYFERTNAPLHIGSIGIFEGQISFERLVAHLDARIALIPRYRQRLGFVPFNLLHPAWEDDPSFHIRNHVRQVSLPPPGNDQQFIELTSELFAPPLDRAKPLWETYVISGLEHERTAILSKVHHCLVDGVSGIDLLMAILDISPEPAPTPEPPPWNPKPLAGAAARLSDAFWDQLNQQRELIQEVQETIMDPVSRLRRAQDVVRALSLASPSTLLPAPRMPFTTALGRTRRVAFSDMSFVEIREIRTSLGGTVNDVVLAVLAGALRRYLSSHGHAVDGVELRVAVPVNVRLEEEQGVLGNRVSCMVVGLPLGEADPAARLNSIRERQDELKQANQAGGFELLMRLATYTPVPVQAAMGASPIINTAVNLICTNVPGPMIPLYSVGHLMLAHYPLVPLSLNMGLGVGVTSYNQRLYFGLMVDPNAVPDVERLKQCLDESFLELRDAAGVPISDLPAFRSQAGNHGEAAVTSTAVTD